MTAPREALLLLFLLFLLLAPPAAPAQAPDSVPAEAAPRAATLPVVGEAILLGHALVHTTTAPLRWGAEEWTTLGLGAGGIALLSLLDEGGRDLMSGSRSEALDAAEEAIEPFGRMRGLQLVGGLYAAGLVLDDAKLRAVATEAVASGVVAAAILQPALAEVVGRPRPRKNRPAHTFDPFSGNISFPSGHTIGAFSAASVIATEYDHPAVRVAAYGLASAVGIARMYAGAHFVSDVAAAAMLGTAVGRSVAGFGRRYRERLRVVPVVTGEGSYLVLTLPL